MLTNLKNKLANNSGINTVMAELNDPGLVHNLRNSDLEELTKIVEDKVGNYKLNGKIVAAIYSIIVMKGWQVYNTKLAI